jgi:flagellum-specific ATP synthase
MATSTSLAALAGLVGRYANPEIAIAPGGHVQTISPGHYTVTGLSRHVRLGDFVAHKSATGTHLGEVVRVEPERVVVCPIEPGDPIGIHDIRTIGAGARSMRWPSRSMALDRCCRATFAVRSPIRRRRR